MEYLHRRLSMLQDLLSSYKGEQPFHLYLRDFFRSNKQCGSRDRKALRALAFAWWRLGVELPEPDMATGIEKAAGILEWAEAADGRSAEWMEFLIQKMEPFGPALSDHVALTDWVLSRMLEPYVWVRMRGGTDDFIQYLEQEGISHISHGSGSVGFSNGTDTDRFPEHYKVRMEVQDIASAEICGLIEIGKDERVWDCCAGSGGKILHLLDEGLEAEVYVSDLRMRILKNLHGRFERAGHDRYHWGEFDLLSSGNPVFNSGEVKIQVKTEFFNHILCDVPCSGSGTWGRSPERWIFHKPEDTVKYAERQGQILRKVWPYLRPGGSIWYITCSVFKSENEDIVREFVQATSNADPVFMQHTDYLRRRGDHLYLARIDKKSFW